MEKNIGTHAKETKIKKKNKIGLVIFLLFLLLFAILRIFICKKSS